MFLEILKWYALSFAVGICTLIVASIWDDVDLGRKLRLIRHPRTPDVSVPVARVPALEKPLSASGRHIKAA